MGRNIHRKVLGSFFLSFSYSKNLDIFEAFCLVITLIISLLFLMSDAKIIHFFPYVGYNLNIQFSTLKVHMLQPTTRYTYYLF